MMEPIVNKKSFPGSKSHPRIGLVPCDSACAAPEGLGKRKHVFILSSAASSEETLKQAKQLFVELLWTNGDTQHIAQVSDCALTSADRSGVWEFGEAGC